MYEKNLLKGKVAIVTGGATGIGKEISSRFANLGAKIAICGRKDEHLDKGLKELKQITKDVVGIRADIRSEQDVQNLFKKTFDKFGKVDILVNNAGGQFIAPFEKISTNGFDAVVKTNLYGTWFCCREATKYMKKKGGKIVNIVHIYAIRAAPGLAHSGAARAGVVNLTKTLAVELAKYKINVNAIAPGITVTKGMREEMFTDERLLKELKATIPLHRFAAPEEIAECVVFLVSPCSDYITGQTLVVDGGQILANWPDLSKLELKRK